MIKKFFQSLLILFLFVPSLASDEFSVMTLNVDNLFDTKDDKNKDDKTYLPIEKKQSKEHIRSCSKERVKSWKKECLFLDWDLETKDSKLKNLLINVMSYENIGPDILALQEVENLNILNQLFELLKPYGYKDLVLIEGNDYRGIDTAIISKFIILDSKLHYINFTGKFEGKDTRPILETNIDLNGNVIKIYNVHFPSGFHDVSMRIDSLNLLSSLLKTHDMPTIALGDFNINNKEDKKFNIYKSQEKYWSVSHLNGCKNCKGTYYYYYENTWEFLDSIFLSKKRNIRYVKNSIDVHTNQFNSFNDTGRPISFNAKNKTGVSDHLPMVAKFSFTN